MTIKNVNDLRLLKFSRNLRKRQTRAEDILWQHLRNRRLSGLKFKRQFVVGSYIVDFVCLSHRLVVEADGMHHSYADIKEYDDSRTDFLKTQGFCIVRFWNYEISSNISAVLSKILSVAKENVRSHSLH